MDAFDADVLIYAAVPGRLLGEQVADLFRSVAPVLAPRRALGPQDRSVSPDH